MEPINILIPLGGKGTRFAGFGSPKALIPIFGKPMISHVLDHLHTIPEDNVVIVYNHTLDDHNFAKIVATKYPHIKLVQLLIQTAGASHTIRAAFPHLHFQKTLVLDCDTFYSNDIVSLFARLPTPPSFSPINPPTNRPFSPIFASTPTPAKFSISPKKSKSPTTPTPAHTASSAFPISNIIVKLTPLHTTANRIHHVSSKP